ncbi:hypothetical protein WME90_21125 [Sorangium sp. So ce375]
MNTEQDALERRARAGGRLRVGGDDLDALEARALHMAVSAIQVPRR